MLDDDLLVTLRSMDMKDLRGKLTTFGVPHLNMRKEDLVRLTFYAIKLGLEVLPTAEEEDKDRIKTQISKLQIDDFLRLPHPSTLSSWSDDIMRFPETTHSQIEEYFARINKECGVDTGGQKAIKDGKSLMMSGHVHNLFPSCIISSCLLFHQWSHNSTDKD